MRSPVQGTVVAVLVAQPATVQVGKKATVTGIRKQAQPGRVEVTARGLSGDHVLNVRHHGGPDQAVYLYTQPDLDAWTEELGDVLPSGVFGENVVVDAWESANLRIGDRLDVRAPDGTPGPLLEVTAPRIPCATLAANVGDPQFVKRFAGMKRPGAYLRVLREGPLGAGDHVTLVPAPQTAPTLREAFELSSDRAPSREQLQSLLAAPLSIRTRKDVEARLARLA